MAGKQEKLEAIVLELRKVEVHSSGWGGLIPPSVWTKRVKMKFEVVRQTWTAC